MTGTLFRRDQKLYARQTFAMNSKLCLRASSCVVALSLLLFLIRISYGHVLYYYVLQPGDTTLTTGVLLSLAGITAALRMDTMGLVLALQFTWQELASYTLEGILVLIMTAPLSYGALEHFDGILRKQVFPAKTLLRWYTDLHLTGRSVLLELLLALVDWVCRIVGVLPGLFLLYRVESAELEPVVSGGLMGISSLLMLLGAVLGYAVSCQLLPARYLLAHDPKRTVFSALKESLTLLKGRRRDYVVFCLSFLPWKLVSVFTYGLADVYYMPYYTLASLRYLDIVPLSPKGATDYGTV